jgi:hypothetical protein
VRLWPHRFSPEVDLAFGRWLTDEQMAWLVRDWPDPPLAMSVMLAESGTKAPDGMLRPQKDVAPVVTSTDPRVDGSRDLGIWQLNSFWHPVGEAVAFDPIKATAYAYKISANGTNFSPWNAWKNGRFQLFFARCQQIWFFYRLAHPES